MALPAELLFSSAFQVTKLSMKFCLPLALSFSISLSVSLYYSCIVFSCLCSPSPFSLSALPARFVLACFVIDPSQRQLRFASLCLTSLGLAPRTCPPSPLPTRLLLLLLSNKRQAFPLPTDYHNCQSRRESGWHKTKAAAHARSLVSLFDFQVQRGV